MPRRFPITTQSDRSMKASQTLLSSLLAAAALLAPPVALAGVTDLQFRPTTSSGHDFNHAPVGQSFQALASNVRAGLYIADQRSFTNWLATVYPGQIQPNSYPYAVAPSIRANIRLLDGEGTGGAVLHSRDVTLTAPFMGFVDVDYAALGLRLTVGRMYTLLVTDISGQAYPNGVTGWVVPAVSNFSTAAALPPGAYAAGLPILQNQLVFNDAGIGDNAFEALDTVAGNGGNPPPVAPTCTGANAVIRSVGADYLLLNAGTAITDRIWYAPRQSITFNAGATSFQPGQLLSYSGRFDAAAGCFAASMTVTPSVTPVTVSGTLPNGQVDVVYAAALTASGGTAPYTWTAAGVPGGLSFAGGRLSGTPTVAGSYALSIGLRDSAGLSSSTAYTVVIAAGAAPVCSKPEGSTLISGSGKVTAVGSGYVTVGVQRLATNSCTKITFRNKDSQLKVGQTIDWRAYSRAGAATAKDLDVR